jgi:hypothetical protein
MNADFVAVYSCEGSGGFSPHFPCASRGFDCALTLTVIIGRRSDSFAANIKSVVLNKNAVVSLKRPRRKNSSRDDGTVAEKTREV